MKFLLWKLNDYRYQSVIIEVCRLLLDMYMGVFGGISKHIDDLVMKELKKKVSSEIHVIE